MTADEFELKFGRGDLDNEYADFLMFKTDELIGNGEMLLRAMESGKYIDQFQRHMTNEA